MYVYLDGARLGMAIMSEESDLTLLQISKLVDAFYIGGTKNGALLGEAIIINNEALKESFRYHMRQRGALLSKGKALGIQFVGLFTDNLYFNIAKHANTMAKKMEGAIKELGFSFLTPAQANQVFPILPNSVIAELEKMYAFFVWTKVDEARSAVRLVTSWATKEDKVDEFIKDLQVLVKNQ
jgi:threonine aldolase